MKDTRSTTVEAAAALAREDGWPDDDVDEDPEPDGRRQRNPAQDAYGEQRLALMVRLRREGRSDREIGDQVGISSRIVAGLLARGERRAA